MGFSEAEFQQLLENQRRAGGAKISDSEAVLLAAAIDHAAPRRKSNTVAKSEAELERACTNILIQDGWRPLKTNPVSRRAHGKGFGEVGMADYLYIRYRAPVPPYCAGQSGIIANATVLWIEFKRHGEHAGDHQRRWHEQERDRGALVLLAGVDFPATVEGFAAWYEHSGLKRGNR